MSHAYKTSSSRLPFFPLPNSIPNHIARGSFLSLPPSIPHTRLHIRNFFIRKAEGGGGVTTGDRLGDEISRETKSLEEEDVRGPPLPLLLLAARQNQQRTQGQLALPPSLPPRTQVAVVV